MIDIERIADICADYAGPGYYVGGRIPGYKLAGARASFPIPARERVLAFVDGSESGKGKNGLAVCETGVYWRNEWSGPTHVRYVNWKEFRGEKVRRAGKTDIELGWGNLFDMSDCAFRKDVLVALLEQIRAYVDKAWDGDQNRGWAEEEEDEDETCRNRGTDGSLGSDDDEDCDSRGVEEDSEEEWMVAIDGQSYGPFDLSLIADMVRSGRVPPDDSYVWKPGMTDWAPFLKQPETAALVNRPSSSSARSGSAVEGGGPSSSGNVPRSQAGRRVEGGTRESGGASANGQAGRDGDGKTSERGSEEGASSAPASVRAIEESVERALSGAANEASAAGPIDVNTASRERLLELPGIGAADVERILQARAANGGFRSAEQVGRLLGLKPHQVVKLRSRTAFGGMAGGTAGVSEGAARSERSPAAGPGSAASGGVDPSSAPTPTRRNPGRIVDF